MLTGAPSSHARANRDSVEIPQYPRFYGQCEPSPRRQCLRLIECVVAEDLGRADTDCQSDSGSDRVATAAAVGNRADADGALRSKRRSTYLFGVSDGQERREEARDRAEDGLVARSGERHCDG